VKEREGALLVAIILSALHCANMMCRGGGRLHGAVCFDIISDLAFIRVETGVQGTFRKWIRRVLLSSQVHPQGACETRLSSKWAAVSACTLPRTLFLPFVFASVFQATGGAEPLETHRV